MTGNRTHPKRNFGKCFEFSEFLKFLSLRMANRFGQLTIVKWGFLWRLGYALIVVKNANAKSAMGGQDTITLSKMSCGSFTVWGHYLRAQLSWCLIPYVFKYFELFDSSSWLTQENGLQCYWIGMSSAFFCIVPGILSPKHQDPGARSGGCLKGCSRVANSRSAN